MSLWLCVCMYVVSDRNVLSAMYMLCHDPFPPFFSGKRAVVGYEDGSVRLWDLKQGNAIHVIKGEPPLSFIAT